MYNPHILTLRPHFLDAPQHAVRVDGLSPEEEKHRYTKYAEQSLCFFVSLFMYEDDLNSRD